MDVNNWLNPATLKLNGRFLANVVGRFLLLHLIVFILTRRHYVEFYFKFGTLKVPFKINEDKLSFTSKSTNNA